MAVLTDWFLFIDNFKQRYALRRCIFGLAGLVSVKEMPQDIKDKITEIGPIIVKVVLRLNRWRREILQDKRQACGNNGDDKQL